MPISPTADKSGHDRNGNDEIFTVFDAAKFLKVDEKTVRKLAKAGELPCFRVGAQYRFTKSALLDLGKVAK